MNVNNPDIPDIMYAPGVEKPDFPDIITPEDVAKEEKEIQEKKDDMRQHKNAILSKASYDYYKFGHDKANEELQKYLPLHSIIDELSDNNATVIQKRNHITIAYRGTDPTNSSDLLADGQIASGNIFSENVTALGRFREADDKYLAVKRAFPDARITLSGHSLGAKLGIHTGRLYDLNGTFFNPGSSPLDAPTEIKEAMKTRNNNFNIHHIFGDPISSSNSWLDYSDKVFTHYISPREYAKQFYTGEVGGHPLRNFYEEDHQLEWSRNASRQPYSLGVYLPRRVINGCKGGVCDYLRPKQRQDHPLTPFGVQRPGSFLQQKSKEPDCLPCPKGKPKCDCLKPKLIKNPNY